MMEERGKRRGGREGRVEGSSHSDTVCPSLTCLYQDPVTGTTTRS